MRLRICTWNVNSVRLRAEQAARFVADQAPDVLCLQEIKCREGEFPREAFVEMGLPHLKIAGQKGWHGVAIASRLPLEDAPPLNVCREGHARCVGAVVAGVEIHNFYVPAGGDVADREVNLKFAQKLDYLVAMRDDFHTDAPAKAILVGDLNIAPRVDDVWDHGKLLKVVSHTPVEVEAMEALKASLGFIDLPRASRPEPEKLASWWSYRAQDFRASNRGLRLDHILVTPGLRDAAFRLGSGASRIHDDVRAWERPSDHAPVSADLML